MSKRIDKHGLQVAADLADFIETRALPGTGVEADAFWTGFAQIVHDLGPKNRALLEKREDLQEKIDAWHIANRDGPHDRKAYKAFLEEIGYLAVSYTHLTLPTNREV